DVAGRVVTQVERIIGDKEAAVREVLGEARDRVGRRIRSGARNRLKAVIVDRDDLLPRQLANFAGIPLARRPDRLQDVRLWIPDREAIAVHAEHEPSLRVAEGVDEIPTGLRRVSHPPAAVTRLTRARQPLRFVDLREPRAQAPGPEPQALVAPQ